ncbi:MAG: MarC family protein, partial [Candidatus Fonsibacter ubiquis]|nr:MarC family protein [Candidatus Fonsibacter ubiquis]
IGPLFLLLTEGATREQRFKIAIKSSLIAFTVLIIFAYGGKFFFNWIGVSINSLKIAGGIILFIISIEMLLDKRRLRREESANKVLSEKTIEEISIFPLAIPLIAGPAALTSVLLLVNANSKDPERLIMVYIALTAVMIVTFFHMIFSAILANYTSKNILNVFSRVIALILASLAIQFIVDGIKSSFGF